MKHFLVAVFFLCSNLLFAQYKPFNWQKAEISDPRLATRFYSLYEQLILLISPATTYTIIGYMLPSISNNALLSIRNMNGTLVWTRKLTKTRDQLVADLSILPNGVYSVSIQIGTTLQATKNLIVAK